jgi:hypothetical protein
MEIMSLLDKELVKMKETATVLEEKKKITDYLIESIDKQELLKINANGTQI